MREILFEVRNNAKINKAEAPNVYLPLSPMNAMEVIRIQKRKSDNESVKSLLKIAEIGKFQ